MAQEAPRVTATTLTRIVTSSPTSPVAVDTFQNPRGSEGGLALRTCLVRNARMGLGAIIWDPLA